jgi:hypothetical protein
MKDLDMFNAGFDCPDLKGLPASADLSSGWQGSAFGLIGRCWPATFLPQISAADGVGAGASRAGYRDHASDKVKGRALMQAATTAIIAYV